MARFSPLSAILSKVVEEGHEDAVLLCFIAIGICGGWWGARKASRHTNNSDIIKIIALMLHGDIFILLKVISL